MAAPTNCYNLRYIGFSTVTKFVPGLGVLQKPLHDLYVAYLTPKGPKMPMASRLALTDRGIILTANGKDSFYSMRDILLWEPMLWTHVQTKDKKIMSAFEPLNPDHHLGQEGLFSKLDSQYKYLAQLKHEPVLGIVLRRSSESKQIEVHAFVFSSEAQVLEVVQALWRAEQLYLNQEAAGIGLTGCSPPIQVHEPPRSVRGSSSGSSVLQVPNVGAERGKQSARQVRGRKVDGEITLEELLRLADRAMGEPVESVVAKDPPFKMGDPWAVKEHKGVQRSRTFNDGPIPSRDQGRDVEMRQGAGVGPSTQPLPGVPFYENVASKDSAPQRTYENTRPEENLQQFPVPVNDERRGSPKVDPKRKSAAPESLRAVLADSRLSAVGGKRGSVLPGTEFNLSVVDLDSNPIGLTGDDLLDQDETPLPNQSKPVALVQPRKVPRFKVLPESVPESVHLHKVPQNPVKEDAKKEQYQAGGGGGSGGGNGRNYTRSMYDLNNISASKPVTPVGQRKVANPEKMTGSDLNLARKSSNPELDPPKKNSSVPDSSNRDGNRSGEKKKGVERGRKDAEMEAMVLSANFERPPDKTMSAHATNFENALGYFP